MDGAFYPPKPWYKRSWGISVIVISGLVVGVFGLYVYTTAKYLRQIKRGETVSLEGPWTSKFTAGKNNQNSNLTVADLSELEKTVYPVLGMNTAPITIVEFGDYKCPNSKAEYPIIRQLASKYPNKVKLLVRDFPIEDGSTKVSALAYCADQQKRFWKVHDYLFEHQDELVDPLPDSFITTLSGFASLNESDLRACLADPATEKAVNSDFIFGAGIGVRGTPTFFINGTKVEGVIPFDIWEKFLNSITS